MADGFIVRRGGKVSEQALAPTITEVSVTDSSITFTIKNEDTETATIVYRIDDLTAEGESISLAGGATSSNITASGLDDDTEFIVFATANVTGKVKSNVTQLAITTDEAPVYTAATGGTTEEYNLDGKRYKSHTFTSNGTFTVTTVGDAIDDRNKVDYLIIAGGGGGGGMNGNSWSGGGGGAGGYRTTVGTSGAESSARDKVTVTATTFAVTVGTGGAASPNASTVPGKGNNSSVAFSTTVSCEGGGIGGIDTSATGGNGGSGGGATRTNSGGTGVANEGRNGGTAASGNPGFAGAGGGGAKDAGTGSTTTSAGNGGDGLANLLRTGSNETRAGGGGGGVWLNESTAVGGAGGGGDGGSSGSLAGKNGTANTGSGGGGGTRPVGGLVTSAGGNGADGIVIIRYEIAPST
jgi:hypothetical protein